MEFSCATVTKSLKEAVADPLLVGGVLLCNCYQVLKGGILTERLVSDLLMNDFLH